MLCYLEGPGDDGIGVAFTDRRGGASTGQFASFNLGHTDQDRLDALRTNMSRLRIRLGLGPVSVVKQVHGTAVRALDAGDAESLHADSWLGGRLAGTPAPPRADAQVTALEGVPLAVRVADCVPVLLADRHVGVIGAAHAGRVGLLDGVLQSAVHAMRDRGAHRIEAWIGPHICGACYEVPAQMQDQACARIPALRATTSWGTPSLDLGLGAQTVLESEGVLVHRVDPCTRTGEEFFSHRGDHGHTGLQIGLIWRAGRHATLASAR